MQSSNGYEIVPQSGFEDKIEEILSRKEYLHLSSFWEKLKEKIIEFLSEMFDTSLDFDDAMMTVMDNKIWLYVGLMFLILTLAIILIKVLGRFQRNPSVKEILGEKISNTTTPESLKEKAGKYKAKGDLTQAIRFNFIALLLLMHEKRVLYLEDSKTNKEIAKIVKQKNLSSGSEFDYISNTFNAVWYGKKECDNAVYVSWLEYMDVVWKEVNSYEE